MHQHKNECYACLRQMLQAVAFFSKKRRFPMIRKALYGSILILFGVVCLLASPGFSATPEPQSEQAKQIKALVDRAAALIESKGKDAFPEFKKKDSEWY